jgi:hypothetical protein
VWELASGWERDGRRAASLSPADAVCVKAFDGLRTRRGTGAAG